MPDGDYVPRSELQPVLDRIERALSKNAEVQAVTLERVTEVRASVGEVKDHQKATNGQVSQLAREQHEMRGGLSVLRWMVATAMGGIGAGAALAAVILAS